MGLIARIVLVLILSVGLLLPKVSAALFAFGLSGSTQIVICTGQGLEVVTIGANGAPIGAVAHKDPCGLVHAVDTSHAASVAPGAFPVFITAFASPAKRAAPAVPRPLSNAPRAPPRIL